MHVRAGDRHAIFLRQREGFVKLLEPHAVFRQIAAGVRLTAVAMSETGIDANGDFKSLRGVSEAQAQLLDHIVRTDVHDATARLADDKINRVLIEDIGGVRDLFRTIPCGESAKNFPRAHSVDKNALFFHELNHGDIGTRLLRESHHADGAQLSASFNDLRGVIDEKGRAAVIRGQLRD